MQAAVILPDLHWSSVSPCNAVLRTRLLQMPPGAYGLKELGVVTVDLVGWGGQSGSNRAESPEVPEDESCRVQDRGRLVL